MMPAALKLQLADVEAHLDGERRAHGATRATAAARQADLEATLESICGALAHTQRALEEQRAQAAGGEAHALPRRVV